MFPKKYFGTIFLFLFFLIPVASAQSVEEIASPANIKLDRERGLNMLDEIKDLIRERYFDKQFRGINLDERFKTAAERVKTARFNGEIFRIIAQVLLDFDDSHTLFYPPARANRVEYGFSLQTIGKKCFVVDVKKGSDAEKKGLLVGDQVIGIGTIAPTRENLWKINYLLYALDPQEKLGLAVRGIDGKDRTLQINAGLKNLKERLKEREERNKKKKENPYECRSINTEIVACKLRTFITDKKNIDKMMREVGAHQKLILDLRGNGGGYVKTEEYLTGYFFDRDVKIATFTMRGKTEDRIAKSQKDDVYKGELIVLIDSESGSASEVFARVIQLEKRGRIIGDVSAGAVMTGVFYRMANQRGTTTSTTVSFYGLSVTIADLIMSDGNRLENVGVTPDFAIGPSARALANKLDPVLGYSIELFGAKISDAEAGQFYFLTPKPEDEADEETTEKEN